MEKIFIKKSVIILVKRVQHFLEIFMLKLKQKRIEMGQNEFKCEKGEREKKSQI